MDEEVCALCQDEGWRIGGLSYWQQLDVLICPPCDFWLTIAPMEDAEKVLIRRGILDSTKVMV